MFAFCWSRSHGELVRVASLAGGFDLIDIRVWTAL